MKKWLEEEITVQGYAEEKYKDKRTRNWWAIVYPDSAPEDWLSRLSEMVVPALVSPLHDKDLRKDGEPKKPHYHVMIMFDGNKSYMQMKEIFYELGGVMVEPVNNTSSAARYLVHRGYNDKAAYDDKGVLQFGGADFQSTCEARADRDVVINEMLDWCERNDIFSFAQLYDFARKFRPDWSYNLSRTCTVFMREMLKSRKWTMENGLKVVMNKETGEIIGNYEFLDRNNRLPEDFKDNYEII